MRFSKLVVVVVCALGALAGGCSGSIGESDSAAPISRDKYPQAYANALCDAAAPCCKAANVMYVEAGCKTAAIESATQQIAGSVGHTRYDANTAGQCVAAIKKAASSCTREDDNVAIACAGILKGTIALGGACTSYRDCADGDCNIDNTDLNASGQGVCVAQTPIGGRAKAGDPCNAECWDREGVRTCQRVDAGQGGSCYASDGLYCGPDTQICTAFAKIGDACSTSAQSSDFVQPPSSGNPYCVTGAYCNDGTCARQVDSGSCDNSPEACSSKSYCALGQCFAKKQDHLGCESDHECVSGWCSDRDENGKGSCGPPSLATPSICSGASETPQQ